MKRILAILGICMFLLPCLAENTREMKPKVFLVGDSTVKNGKDKGDNNQWGWGHFLPLWFKTGDIYVENHAMGGRSSRTFINEGRWDSIYHKLEKGDYVLIQMGHNDGGDLDTGRARGSLKGVGEEFRDIVHVKPDNVENEGKHERVYTYGYYLRKYIRETREKGAYPVICSPVPRERWKEGKVERDVTYPVWAEQVAHEEKVPFIDLHNLVADKYDIFGEVIVKDYFKGDHTHSSFQGAMLNAETVAEAVAQLKKCRLKKFLKGKL